MKTISVQLSDVEYRALGLSKNSFSFSEIADLIEKQKRQQIECLLLIKHYVSAI
jgi:predicted CopG family antitoxin